MKTQLKVPLILFFVAFHLQNLYPQIGIGTTSPHTSSILDVESPNKGFLLPRMNTEKRDDINDGVFATGLMIYNTDENCLNVYNGSDWINLCGEESTSLTGLPDNISSIPRGNASISTKYCFDIAEGNNLTDGCGYLENRKSFRSNFNDVTTNTQTLTFTSPTPVSHLTFYSEDTTGLVIESFTTTLDYSALTNFTTATATIIYKTNISSPDPDNTTTSTAHGRSTFEALRTQFYAVYNNSNDGTGDEVKVTTGILIKDCNCSGFNKRSGTGHHFITTEGKAYAMGENGSTAPWIGNNAISMGPNTKVDTLSPVAISNPIIGISEGFFHSLYLDLLGDVYITNYKYDSLSQNNIGTGIPEKIKMPNDKKAYYTTSTQQRAYARTTDGTIYCWGQLINNQEQLGSSTITSTTSSSKPIPLTIPTGINVVDFDVAHEANFLLTDDGKVYSAGIMNVSGRLTGGHSPFQEILFPVDAGKIVKIKALSSTGIALDENGKVFSWGSNYFGEGMQGISNTNTTQPKEVNLPTGMGRPIEIYAGHYTIFILDDNNEIWASGRNDNGGLGIGNNSHRGTLTKCLLPSGLIPMDIIPKQGATLILGNDGKYYSSGSGYSSTVAHHTYTGIYRANNNSSKPANRFHSVEHPDFDKYTFIPY